jgi:G3E family GTPase
VLITQPGLYALFTQHHPDEFTATLQRVAGDSTSALVPVWSHVFKPDHEHDDEVTSVGITTPGDVDPKKLNDWIGELLRVKGNDIFRCKGVLAVKGSPNRLVFQGVHMLFDGKVDRPWGNEARTNTLIFIGRNLDREALHSGFRACLV